VSTFAYPTDNRKKWRNVRLDPEAALYTACHMFRLAVLLTSTIVGAIEIEIGIAIGIDAT